MPSCAYAIKSLFKPSFMESLTTITDRIKASIAVKEKIISDGTLIPVIHSVVELITNAFRNGNAVYFCGNGGSAADAQHLAAEFSGRFYKDRKALPSEALHCNTSYLTAVANDYSYDVIYARLIEGIAKKGDVLIGLSTSGNSANILRAFEKAAELGVITIGMTGASGGKMKDQCHYLINVPSSDTPRIQESHILIGHILCELTEKNLFG
jgi:D-sedoheptulose 7-phosphate isomerase